MGPIASICSIFANLEICKSGDYEIWRLANLEIGKSPDWQIWRFADRFEMLRFINAHTHKLDPQGGATTRTT